MSMAMLLVTLGIVCIGLTLASFMNSLECYGTIYDIRKPAYVLTQWRALFPVNNLPSWLKGSFTSTLLRMM